MVGGHNGEAEADMADESRDLARTMLVLLFIGGLMLASFLVMRPFLPAVVWASVPSASVQYGMDRPMTTTIQNSSSELPPVRLDPTERRQVGLVLPFDDVI
jgi:hypothetical protein